jgi:hypothetical protein
LQNPRIYFDKTIKQQEKGNRKTIYFKMTKQGSLKTHLAKSGYKPKVAMQLKFKDTIVKRQVTLYLRSVVVVGRLKKSTMMEM